MVWNIFSDSSLLGEWSNLTNLFHMGWNHQTDVIRSSFFCNWWGSDGNLMLWDMGTGLCCRYLPVSTAVLCLAVDAQTEWFRMVYGCWSRLALEPFKARVNQNGLCGQRCRPMWQKEIGDLRKSSGLAGKSCFERPFRLFLEARLKLHHFGDIWGTFWKCGSRSNIQGILTLPCSLRHLYSYYMSVSTPLHICLHACKCPPFVAITHRRLWDLDRGFCLREMDIPRAYSTPRCAKSLPDFSGCVPREMVPWHLQAGRVCQKSPRSSLTGRWRLLLVLPLHLDAPLAKQL